MALLSPNHQRDDEVVKDTWSSLFLQIMVISVYVVAFYNASFSRYCFSSKHR